MRKRYQSTVASSDDKTSYPFPLSNLKGYNYSISSDSIPLWNHLHGISRNTGWPDHSKATMAQPEHWVTFEEVQFTIEQDPACLQLWLWDSSWVSNHFSNPFVWIQTKSSKNCKIYLISICYIIIYDFNSDVLVSGVNRWHQLVCALGIPPSR